MKITLPTPIPITDHTQLTSIGTTTHAAIDAALSGYSEIKTDTHFITGFVNRTTSSISLSGQTVSIAPSGGASFDIYSDGLKINKTGGASCSTDITNTIGLHFIYFNSSGTLTSSTSAWTITSNNVPVAIVYWDGTKGVLYDERHQASRNLNWHEWAHETIGTRYESGLVGVFSTNPLTVSDGYIHDEDIDFHITAQNSTRVWYRAAGAASMTFDSAGSAYAAKVVSGALKYDNGGTLTSVGASKFVVNWVYATLETGLPIMTVVGQAEYNTVALARQGAQPTFPNFPTVEMKLLYSTIWQNSGGTPTFVEATDYRTSSALPSGGTGITAATNVSFSPSGNIASTNIQAAIEELDTEKAAAAKAAYLIDLANATLSGDAL